MGFGSGIRYILWSPMSRWGAWTAALVLDTADMVAPRPHGFRQAAQLSIGLGVLGGIAAALTGLTDWQHTHDDARRAGIVHGALNTGALTLYGVSWLDLAVEAGTLGPRSPAASAMG
jgi:hypothetical protein